MKLLDRLAQGVRGVFRGDDAVRSVAPPPWLCGSGEPRDAAIDRLAAMRSRGPAHYIAARDEWLLVGYDAVKAAFAQPQLFSSRCAASTDPVLLGADPPGHAAVRRVVARQFSSDQVDRLVALVESEAPRLIRPKFDLVGDYAASLTRSVARALIGLDETGADAVAAAVEASRGPLGFAGGAGRSEAVRTTPLFLALLRDGGGVIDADGASSIVHLLWRAAIDTTELAIVRSALALLEDEALRRTIEADVSRLPALVEEIVRLYPPAPAHGRIATAPTAVGDCPIPAGARVRLSVAAANRDPTRFDDPDALRLDRPRQLHLSFGSGVHRCVGATLGRRTAVAALDALVRHRPRLRALQPLGSVPHCNVGIPVRLAIGV